MRVLKVVVEGITTSFRYPHFMQQIHPSFRMPPPATIYGHICSALGEWVDPADVRFAYHFTHEGETTDMEHIIVLSASTGVLKGTTIPKVLEGNVNPFERDLLFKPRLTLYINKPEWEPAFRSPRYAVVLGRSQDLCTYRSVEVVDLEQAEQAYFEHTLVPYQMALQVGRGITLMMPRYLDNENGRAPSFGRYLQIEERVHLPPGEDEYRFDHMRYGPYWIDPATPEEKGARRGLSFLSFTGDNNEAFMHA